MIFTKLFFNYKISCISTSFVKEIRILSHIAKSYRPVNICKPAYSRQGCVKNVRCLHRRCICTVIISNANFSINKDAMCLQTKLEMVVLKNIYKSFVNSWLIP